MRPYPDREAQMSHDVSTDEAELARFGYRQELQRSLGLFSSFAVAFSYISPSTGIFTLFACEGLALRVRLAPAPKQIEKRT